MVADKWLMTIGWMAQTLIRAIGYFFGFTIVTMLTVGWIVPDSFDNFGRHRRHWWAIVHKKSHRWILVAEAVTAVGWLFLALANLVFWWCQS